MNLKSMLFPAALLGLAAAVAAAPVDLAAARETALRKSEPVRQAKLAADSAALSERSALADLFPSLSAGGGVSASSKDWSAVEYVPSASLTANWTLFSGGTGRNALRSAALETAQAAEALRAARLAVVAETDARYLDALKTARTYETALKDLQAADRKLEIAAAKKEAGTLSEPDYLQTLASRATKRTAAVQAKWAAEASARKLSAYLGTAAEASPLDDAYYGDLARRVGERARNDPEALAKAFYALGRAADPDLRSKEAAVAVAGLAVANRKAAFLPTVSLSASVKASSTEAAGVAVDPSFGLSASLPLLPVSGKAAAVGAAENDEAGARSRLAEAEEELLLSFYSATFAILSAEGSIESADAALEYAERNHGLALEKFRLGSGTLSDLADAEATLSTARAQTVGSRFDLYAAVTELGRLLGTEDERGLEDALD